MGEPGSARQDEHREATPRPGGDRIADALERIAGFFEREEARHLADRAEREAMVQRAADEEAALAAAVREAVPDPPDQMKEMMDLAQKMMRKVVGEED